MGDAAIVDDRFPLPVVGGGLLVVAGLVSLIGGGIVNFTHPVQYLRPAGQAVAVGSLVTLAAGVVAIAVDWHRDWVLSVGATVTALSAFVVGAVMILPWTDLFPAPESGAGGAGATGPATAGSTSGAAVGYPAVLRFGVPGVMLLTLLGVVLVINLSSFRGEDGAIGGDVDRRAALAVPMVLLAVCVGLVAVIGHANLLAWLAVFAVGLGANFGLGTYAYTGDGTIAGGGSLLGLACGIVPVAVVTGAVVPGGAVAAVLGLAGLGTMGAALGGWVGDDGSDESVAGDGREAPDEAGTAGDGDSR